MYHYVQFFQILFKNRVEIESAVVLAVKRNALQVLIPKYGLEGPLYLPSEKFTYNEEVRRKETELLLSLSMM